jgi:tetratricopeptide (TPR) repeat protein
MGAAHRCQEAYDVVKEFGRDDPRVASSLNNVGIALRVKMEFDEAEQYYRDALEAWKASSGWVDKMRLAQRARSSLFHLRLEQKHREQYNRIALEKYRKLLWGGSSATVNNLAELFHQTGKVQDAKRLYDQALEKRLISMGPDEAGVAVIRENMSSLRDPEVKQEESDSTYWHALAGNDPFSSQAVQQGWIVDNPPEFTDEGRLMAAILLAGLLDRSFVCQANS